jgi:hypothetical protein
MTSCYWLKRGAKPFAPLLIMFVILAALLVPLASADADGGVAVSGSFSSQVFELAQGSSVNVSSVYVTVFNTGGDSINVRMVSEAPVGVVVNLSLTDFVLSAGSEQRVIVGITTTADVAPGEYTIDITAEPYRYNAGGIQVVGSAGLSAVLKVVGEGGTVTVNLVSVDSTPIVGEVRLFKVISGKDYEIARSLTGALSTAVAPGSFYAVAYAGEDEIARESFDVVANENKVINLVARTIYFVGFDPVPAYSNDTGLLHHVKMVYTLENLYQPVSDVEVFLQVSRDGVQLERPSILSISTLDIGSLGTSYNYVPFEGWVDGNYSFQLQLYISNSFFTGTLVKSLDVGGAAVTPTLVPDEDSSEGSSNMGMIIGIAVAAVVVGAFIVYFAWRWRTRQMDRNIQRRGKHSKARKP